MQRVCDWRMCRIYIVYIHTYIYIAFECENGEGGGCKDFRWWRRLKNRFCHVCMRSPQTFTVPVRDHRRQHDWFDVFSHVSEFFFLFSLYSQSKLWHSQGKKNAKFRMCWRLSLLADANEPAPCEHFDNLHFVLTETREHEIQNETTNETNETNEKSQQHVHKNAYAASTTSQIHPISPQLKWFIVSNHILCIIRIQIGLSATAVVCRVREREKRHEKKAKHRQQRNCTMYIATWNCLANAIIWSVRVQ